MHPHPTEEPREDLAGLLDRAAMEMASLIVKAYKDGSRFGYKSDARTHLDPMYQINRILDTAVSRNRVVEQCARCRDDIEDLIKFLWPCKDHMVMPPQVVQRLQRVVNQLTEVLVDATGD